MKLWFFHLDKYKKDTNVKIDVCAMFKIKYGLNKICLTSYLHQVKWFVGKELVSMLEV
jgi:hypothetical protein